MTAPCGALKGNTRIGSHEWVLYRDGPEYIGTTLSDDLVEGDDDLWRHCNLCWTWEKCLCPTCGAPVWAKREGRPYCCECGGEPSDVR